MHTYWDNMRTHLAVTWTPCVKFGPLPNLQMVEVINPFPTIPQCTTRRKNAAIFLCHRALQNLSYHPSPREAIFV